MIAVVLRCGDYFLLDKIHSFGSYLFGGTIDRLGRGAPGSGMIGSFTVSDSVIFQRCQRVVVLVRHAVKKGRRLSPHQLVTG